MAGGSAGGGGYQFQAAAGAYVAAHALRRKPLGWLEKPGQDVPAALLAETGSGGDDWRIELDDGSLIEIECKRGLKRGERLWEALLKLAGAVARAPARSGILLVDGTSADAIKNHLPQDLRRIGQGRTDGLKDISAEFRSRLEKENLDPGSICQRLTIVTLDLVKGKTDGRRALELLERVVEKRSTQVAWKALSDECLQLIADRGRRDTQAWLHFLAAAGVPLAKQFWRVVAPPDQQPAPALRPYLHRLVRGCKVLPLESLDQHTASDPRDAPDITLDAIYTALLTYSIEGEHPKEERAVPDMPHRTRRLSALDQAARYPRLVLLGDPGSGKSTFVNFVALCLAGECVQEPGIGLEQLTAPLPGGEGEEARPQPWSHGPLVPVRVVLRDFAARGLPPGGQRASAENLWRFIETLPECAGRKGVAALKARLRDHGGLMLLDGLDEVAEAGERREQIKQAVEDFADCYPKCRVVVTSRTYAYQHQGWRLRDFQEVELAPFTQQQIAYFIDHWYASVARSLDQHADEASRRAALLKQAIARNERLAELAERPLLLMLMANLHARRTGDLPERREKLYAEAVELLLERWQRRTEVSSGDARHGPRSLLEWLRVDRQKVRKLLERLAYEAHAAQPDLDGTADIAERDLVDGILALQPEDVDVKPKLLVEYLRDRAGLLIARGEGVYTFAHRTFQEYLTACHLTAKGPGPGNLVKLFQAEPARWREVLLLAAAKLSDGWGIWSLIDALCKHEPGKPEEGAAEVWSAHIAGLALAEMPEPGGLAGENPETVGRVRRWLVHNMEGRVLAAKERALAGVALDRLGDVRFNGDRWSLPDEELLGFVKIPAGSFRMGEGREQHEVTVPEYYIGRYPVTVGQFRAYCRARQLKLAPWVLEGASNLPVAGVSWQEALGYCEWLTGELVGSECTPPELRRLLRGEEGKPWRVTLPSEAEWEKAARGDKDGRIYPWGDEWDAERVNCEETGIGERSAVGCFGGGQSPYGIEEMSGNVWEWTRGRWEKYPYPEDARARAVRESLKEDEMYRVVRGGSFIDLPGYVRCAVRYYNRPSERYLVIGFRVVVSPFNSEL